MQNYGKIAAIITLDFKLRYLVADSYRSYKNLVGPRRKLHSCWVHVRRMFIKALNPEELGKTYANLSDEEVIAQIKSHFDRDSHCAAMLTLFTGVSKLYELECAIDKTVSGWEKLLEENRRQSRQVIAQMDKVIAAVAPELTEKTANGTYRAKSAAVLLPSGGLLPESMPVLRHLSGERSYHSRQQYRRGTYPGHDGDTQSD